MLLVQFLVPHCVVVEVEGDVHEAIGEVPSDVLILSVACMGLLNQVLEEAKRERSLVTVVLKHSDKPGAPAITDSSSEHVVTDQSQDVDLSKAGLEAGGLEEFLEDVTQPIIMLSLPSVCKRQITNHPAEVFGGCCVSCRGYVY